MRHEKILITSILLVIALLGSPLKASAASLNFTPTSHTVAINQTFDIEVLLDTKGAEIEGVDFYFLRFDPKILEVMDSNPNASGIQIAATTTLGSTLSNSADNTAGTIRFSQIVPGGSSFNGIAKLATITFKAKTAGTTDLTFDFKRGATDDTNVAAMGTDALTSVGNSKVTVTSPTTSTSPNPTPTPAATQDPPTSENPPIVESPTNNETPDPVQSNEDGEGTDNNYTIWIILAAAILLGGVIFMKKLMTKQQND